MTYSIAAYDQENEEWGVAVQSKFLAVGSLVPWAKAGVGAIATQAKTNANYGKRGFELIEQGLEAEEVIEKLVAEDEEGEARQVGVVDTEGKTAAYTGEGCLKWAGHRTGDNYTCQGNVLLGEVVLKEMEASFQTSNGDLADRLLQAIEAAQQAGGERRGRQSAALIVKKFGEGFFGEINQYVDLRVDDSLTPIQKLRKLLEKHRIEYAPNHRNKYYQFAGETKHKLLERLKEVDIIEAPLEGTAKEAIYQFGEENGFTRDKIFKGDLINGEVVNELVNLYYQSEYEVLK